MKIFRKSGRTASHLYVPGGAREWIAPVPKPWTEGSLVPPARGPFQQGLGINGEGDARGWSFFQPTNLNATGIL